MMEESVYAAKQAEKRNKLYKRKWKINKYHKKIN